MLYYALVFLVVALLAGLLGFGVVAFAAAEIARIFFFVFIVLFLVSLISHLFRRSRTSWQTAAAESRCGSFCTSAGNFGTK